MRAFLIVLVLVLAAPTGCARREGTDQARPGAAADGAADRPERVTPPPRTAKPPADDPGQGFVKMDVVGVAPTDRGNAVVLTDPDRQRALLIFVGSTEALSIELRLAKRTYPRPLTHDLFDSALDQLGARVESVRVDKLEAGTFHGTVVLRDENRRLELDARSSDAIALALGSGVPIHVARDVLHRAGVDLDQVPNLPPGDAGPAPRVPDPGSVAL